MFTIMNVRLCIETDLPKRIFIESLLCENDNDIEPAMHFIQAHHSHALTGPMYPDWLGVMKGSTDNEAEG